MKIKVPSDGSVPDITAWQSLRKCSKAPQYLHDESMPRPALDSEGRVLVDETNSTEDSPPQDDLPLLPADEPPVRKYMIDKIIRAERRGGGWTVHRRPGLVPLTYFCTYDLGDYYTILWLAHPLALLTYENHKTYNFSARQVSSLLSSEKTHLLQPVSRVCNGLAL